MALAFSTGSDEAARACAKAADLLAKVQGLDSAADYLAEAVTALWAANAPAAWDLAAPGLAIIGARRDATWATLAWTDEPGSPGHGSSQAERRGFVESKLDV